MCIAFTYRAITVFGAPFQGNFGWRLIRILWVLQPRPHKEDGLGLAPFARRY